MRQDLHKAGASTNEQIDYFRKVSSMNFIGLLIGSRSITNFRSTSVKPEQ